MWFHVYGPYVHTQHHTKKYFISRKNEKPIVAIRSNLFFAVFLSKRQPEGIWWCWGQAKHTHLSNIYRRECHSNWTLTLNYTNTRQNLFMSCFVDVCVGFLGEWEKGKHTFTKENVWVCLLLNKVTLFWGVRIRQAYFMQWRI